MFLKTLMKKPVLMVGILLMVIFLLDLNNRGKLFNRDSLKPTSCRSVLVMLNKRIPATWKTKCKNNNLRVDISVNTSKNIKQKNLRAFIYRNLANNLIFIAKNSLNESLERVNFVHVHMDHKKMSVNALTEGKFICKFASITNKKFIAEHIQSTVQVKETIK